MELRDVMTQRVEVIRPDATLCDAARKMRELDVGALPVCDGRRLHGMITDRDITVRAVAEGRDPRRTTVREVATSRVIYCFEDDDVREVGRTMREHQIRRIPVLDRNKRLVGIVALGDIATMSDDRMAGDVLEGVSQPKHFSEVEQRRGAQSSQREARGRENRGREGREAREHGAFGGERWREQRGRVGSGGDSERWRHDREMNRAMDSDVRDDLDDGYLPRQAPYEGSTSEEAPRGSFRQQIWGRDNPQPHDEDRAARYRGGADEHRGHKNGVDERSTYKNGVR